MSAVIRSVGYPIIVDLGVDTGGEFSIYVNALKVFTGRSIDRYVDISGLLRDYANAEAIILDMPNGIGLPGASFQSNATVHVVTGVHLAEYSRVQILPNDYVATILGGDTDFVVVSNENAVADITLFVANDYNDDCIGSMAGEGYFTSVFIGGKVDPRQICFFAANTSEASLRLSITGGGGIVSYMARRTGGGTSVIGRYIAGDDIDTITADILTPTATAAMSVDVAPCLGGRYVLYAINKRGGITHAVMQGRPLESFTRKNFDIETDYNKLSPVGRSVRRIQATTTRKWRLNTGIMNERDAAHMDDIINSPRVVLHDLDAGRLFAVNPTDTSVDRQTRKSNARRPIEYTINVEEARKNIRR